MIGIFHSLQFHATEISSRTRYPNTVSLKSQESQLNKYFGINENCRLFPLLRLSSGSRNKTFVYLIVTFAMLLNELYPYCHRLVRNGEIKQMRRSGNMRNELVSLQLKLRRRDDRCKERKKRNNK